MGQLVSDVTDVLKYHDDKKNTNESKKQIMAEIAADEAEKQNLVEKSLAAQRAKYGAKGMATKGQTEDAVLNRIKSEIENPYEKKKKANIEKLKSARAKKKNLLLAALEHLDKLIG